MIPFRMNPRANPALNWADGTTANDALFGIKVERTDALRIPQLKLRDLRPGRESGTASTGLAQGFVQVGQEGGSTRFRGYFILVLPFDVATNRGNSQKFKQAGFRFNTHPYELHARGQHGLYMMSSSGQSGAASQYSRTERDNLAGLEDDAEFSTLAEAKAWVQSKVDALSNITLVRP